MNKFKDLLVWNKSIDLAALVYQLTTNYPNEEKYGLVSQRRRSVISIASNIAEGAGRNSKKEFAHFLSIGIGSSFELETQLVLNQRLNFIKKEELESLLEKLNEIQKMINGL